MEHNLKIYLHRFEWKFNKPEFKLSDRISFFGYSEPKQNDHQEVDYSYKRSFISFDFSSAADKATFHPYRLDSDLTILFNLLCVIFGRPLGKIILFETDGSAFEKQKGLLTQFRKFMNMRDSAEIPMVQNPRLLFERQDDQTYSMLCSSRNESRYFTKDSVADLQKAWRNSNSLYDYSGMLELSKCLLKKDITSEEMAEINKKMAKIRLKDAVKMALEQYFYCWTSTQEDFVLNLLPVIIESLVSNGKSSKQEDAKVLADFLHRECEIDREKTINDINEYLELRSQRLRGVSYSAIKMLSLRPNIFEYCHLILKYIIFSEPEMLKKFQDFESRMKLLKNE